MTAMTRWNPTEEVGALQNRLSSFFDWTPELDAQDLEILPTTDVLESDNEYVIWCDLSPLIRLAKWNAAQNKSVPRYYLSRR